MNTILTCSGATSLEFIQAKVDAFAERLTCYPPDVVFLGLEALASEIRDLPRLVDIQDKLDTRMRPRVRFHTAILGKMTRMVEQKIKLGKERAGVNAGNGHGDDRGSATIGATELADTFGIPASWIPRTTK